MYIQSTARTIKRKRESGNEDDLDFSVEMLLSYRGCILTRIGKSYLCFAGGKRHHRTWRNEDPRSLQHSCQERYSPTRLPIYAAAHFPKDRRGENDTYRLGRADQ